MAQFTDKAYVITGGSSGIGLATAIAIAAAGGKVLVTGSNSDKLQEVASAWPQLHTLLNDAADPAAADALAARAAELFGTLDGVFLNAGKGGGAPLAPYHAGHVPRAV
jgi:NAD(P)-dependent dehydrogenase (short-subunit alcohol dehydrogenase family)